jgi:phosphoglycolate phosphatase
MNSKFDNILFDLDGTLTDPAEGIINSVIYALDKMGFDSTERLELLHFIGPPLTNSFMKHCHVDKDTAELMISYYREYFSISGKFENKIYDGVIDLLSGLNENGFNLFVATSKPTVFAREILLHFNLDSYFLDIVGSNLDHTRTLKAEVISYIVEEHNLNPAKCIMIGDRKHDLIGAEECGINSIAVRYGYGTTEEFENHKPIAIVDDISQLKSVLCN